MADKEKRIKLGVDVGDLANQLIQINNYTDRIKSLRLNWGLRMQKINI